MNETKTANAAVTVSLKDLRNASVPFSTLEEAFGPSSLGIIIVKDLPPEFIELRLRLLSYASYLANLSPEILETLSCPEAKYLTGWSHGKEALRSGHYDTLKGSYYVNCGEFYQSSSPHSQPTPKTQTSLASPPPSSPPSPSSFPEYTTPNIWPPTSLLPTFRSTFQDLCILIIDTAVLVARACDRYASAHIDDYPPGGYLEQVVRSSTTTKARLLHYFPPSTTSTEEPSAPIFPGFTDEREKEEEEEEEDNNDTWCATHVDHGCLTGLTSALYIDEALHPPFLPSTSTSSPSLPSLRSPPSPSAGLYIRSRTNTITKIDIPSNTLAFQTGEALEVITRGKFRAVPHFVRGPRGGGESSGRIGGRSKVARNTLAVFTQPNLEEVVDRERGITFGEFARGVVERHT